MLTGINLGGAMGKNAPYFSKWPLHLESMGPFYNVKRWAVMFLYESVTRNGPCYRLANNIPVLYMKFYFDWPSGFRGEDI